jgi:MFS family permease
LNDAVKARIGTALLFVVDGVGFGVWAAHIPAFRDALHLTASTLSYALLALVIGSICTMPLAGAIIHRRGSRPVACIAATVYIFALLGLASVVTFPHLLLFAALFGASKGALDVSINAQGAYVEQRLGKPVVSSFQGFWSLGGLVGAAASSFALRRGFGTHQDFLFAAVLLTLCSLAGAPFLLKEPPHAPQPKAEKTGLLPRFDPRLLRLAMVAFLGLFGEGAMADWDGVFLKTSVGVSLSKAAIGYAAFSIAMASGRFAGDALIARFHPKAILRLSGTLLAVGVLLALTLNVWWAAIAGFICAALGVANIVPVIWGAAGRDRVIGAGPALATVTTVGYFGFLAGPPLIGFLATFTNLRLALGVVALFGLAIALLAKYASEDS